MNHSNIIALVLLLVSSIFEQTVNSACEETAFAYFDDISLCFIDDSENSFDRWGWTIGPIDVSSGYDGTGDIYAGAGQCDSANKGTLVGSIDVTINVDGSFDVTYTATDGSDYTWDEFHFYIGTDKYPTDTNGDYTVAPGSYTYKETLDDSVSSYTISGNIENFNSENEYYFIAHSVTCDCCDEPTTDTETGTPDTPDTTIDTPDTPDTTVNTPDTPDTTITVDIPDTDTATTGTPDDTEECEGYYIILSNGWYIDTLDGTFDGIYVYDSDTQSFINEENNNYRIFYETIDYEYYLDVGDITNVYSQFYYKYGAHEWNNDNNPFYNSDDESNWETSNEETEFSTGDMTLYDCNDVNLGSELCDLDGTSYYPFIYSCDEGGTPTIISQSGRLHNVNVFVYGIIVTGLLLLLIIN